MRTALDIPVVDFFVDSAISLFRQVTYSNEYGNRRYKDFNNAAMFQVAGVKTNSNNRAVYDTSAPPDASYALSVKILESFRLGRRYQDQTSTEPTVITVPQLIYEEYDVIYMN